MTFLSPYLPNRRLASTDHPLLVHSTTPFVLHTTTHRLSLQGNPNKFNDPNRHIVDCFEDGDEVVITLQKKVEVDELGNPKFTKWASLAFSKSAAGQKRHEVVEKQSQALAEQKEIGDQKDRMAEKFEKDRKATEMKVLLTSQLNSLQDIATAMDSDWQMIDAEAVEDSPRERDSVKLVFENNFLKFNEIFQHYCGIATASSIGLMEFLHIMDDFQLNEGDDSTEVYLQLWELVHKKWLDDPAVPNNALTRSLFLEAFLRLAVNKFKTSQVSTSAALENLISDFINPGLARLQRGDEARTTMKTHVRKIVPFDVMATV
jgi:hypothetical protein